MTNAIGKFLRAVIRSIRSPASRVNVSDVSVVEQVPVAKQQVQPSLEFAARLLAAARRRL